MTQTCILTIWIVQIDVEVGDIDSRFKSLFGQLAGTVSIIG